MFTLDSALNFQSDYFSLEFVFEILQFGAHLFRVEIAICFNFILLLIYFFQNVLSWLSKDHSRALQAIAI
jgi:hypothetical protein